MGDDNKIIYTQLKETGPWLIRVPLDMFCKEGDSVNVGRFNTFDSKVLGKYVHKNHKGKYYEQVK